MPDVRNERVRLWHLASDIRHLTSDLGYLATDISP
jgi:hypothetical protein